MMIDWIKRAWRGWFGPKPAQKPWIGQIVGQSQRADCDYYSGHQWNAAVVARAAREATIAQKNVRLASIARERNRLKDQLDKAIAEKKKRSHIYAELRRLSTRELQIIYGKEPSMAIGGDA